ncbi:hypothetical protein ABT324_28875 [Saccharopolyspora sp. NPDC000359]|uniref:hypothetical protein n=1 Tax=Saccharopolyspora sp. NPDC000359 TaxID=3154251 RepID=UPI00332275F8
MPSADPLLPFEVTLVVKYRVAGTGSPPSAQEIAAEGITQRAEELSRAHSLTECDRLRGKLAIALSRWQEVARTGVCAQAQCTSVTADPELASAVAARESAARRQAVLSWQHEQREHSAARLRSLIVDPLRATAWWFADNQDAVDKLPEVAKQFQAVRDLLAPTAAEESAGQLLDEYLTDVDVVERGRVLFQLRRMFGEHRRDDLAERIDSVDRDEPGPG